MLDLTDPMSRGSSGVWPAPAPYSPSIAMSSWLSPTTVPVPWASTYWMSDGSTPVTLHTCKCQRRYKVRESIAHYLASVVLQ